MFNVLKKIAVLAAVLSSPCVYGQGAINGVITDESGMPIRGASVVLNPGSKTTSSDSFGRFYFKNLRPDSYYLHIQSLGYRDYSDTIRVDSDIEKPKIVMEVSPFMTDEVVVRATRFSQNAPATFSNMDEEEIEKLNLGQDLPYILNQTPSLVTTSDAGAGVGYTSMRIRGSDQTRINVTLNGIPINDSESQGVFWVNMPDLASSLSSIQIQRGLGTSTNGSGAFGASVNMETSLPLDGPGGTISGSYGSFNTHKATLNFHSGLLEDGFAISGRLSNIGSDGYIDRASSSLKSYFLSAGYFGKKTGIKVLTFSGKERTYQSWYGTPEARINNDIGGMITHAARERYTESQTRNLLNSGRTYNYYQYENQVDDYQQTHYQLHITHGFTPYLSLAVAGHFTHGEGFFEEYESNKTYAEFGKIDPIIGNDTIRESDFIIRRWLNNDFYGGIFGLDYTSGYSHFTLGGGAHVYRGHHYGEILWTEVSTTIDHLEEYYRNIGNKDEYNLYAKWDYTMDRWNFMLDMQMRGVVYETKGLDNDQSIIDVSKTYLFFNPKAGVRYSTDLHNSFYLYVGRGNREPVRNDFIDAPQGKVPEHETLNNVELGYNYKNTDLKLQVNSYYMGYKNQLVLTGQLNDVGSAIRQNVDKSYRLGVEMVGSYMLTPKIGMNFNATYSWNKIRSFDEIITREIIPHSNTDISFSPSIIASGGFIWLPVDGLEFNIISKYVGSQYLDNTQNKNRSLDAYWINNVLLTYTIQDVVFKEIGVSVLVNNIFDVMYASNGYTYSYEYNGLVTENFYYPQAGVNFLLGLDLRF